MAKKNIKHKRLSNKEFNQLDGYHPLTDLSLNTGARIAEIKRLIDEYESGMDYIDIKTKKSDGTNRIHLNKKSIDSLKKLKKYKGVTTKTLQRKYKSISDEIGIKFSSHNLRSTFGSRLMENGVDIVTTSILMNHSSIEQTAQYIQFSENRLRTATEILNEHQTLEGMNMFELMNEIVKLRERLRRKEEK